MRCECCSPMIVEIVEAIIRMIDDACDARASINACDQPHGATRNDAHHPCRASRESLANIHAQAMLRMCVLTPSMRDVERLQLHAAITLALRMTMPSSGRNTAQPMRCSWWRITLKPIAQPDVKSPPTLQPISEGRSTCISAVMGWSTWKGRGTVPWMLSHPLCAAQPDPLPPSTSRSSRRGSSNRVVRVRAPRAIARDRPGNGQRRKEQ